MLDLIALCLVITALLAWLNARFVGLPIAIGVMGAALVLSLTAIGLDELGLSHGLRGYLESLVRSIDFSDVLMQGMLSLLLFAGALHVDLRRLKAYRWQVGALAVVSTVLSTVFVGFVAWWALPWVGLHLPLAHCLVFGALISPTDPIAVMGILKSSGAPKDLEMVIAGESLFNDGVGVVLFSLLAELLRAGQLPSAAGGAVLLLQEAGGGLVFGAVLGFLVLRLLRSVDNPQVEVLVTLAAVLGGYALASRLHVSGPLAMVVTGLMIGNGKSDGSVSTQTRGYMDPFWELIDEILNAVLFVLIGMEALVVPFSWHLLAGGAIAVAITLVARTFTVGLPVTWWPGLFRLQRGAGWVLTWGGLRGGISVALALSMPAGAERDTVLALTYCIVVFSILGQGLTIGRVVRWAVVRTG